jgi:hypothetical protein
VHGSNGAFTLSTSTLNSQLFCSSLVTHHLSILVNFFLLTSSFFLSVIRVTFVKELPKTATGKIQKYILRAQRLAIAPQ